MTQEKYIYKILPAPIATHDPTHNVSWLEIDKSDGFLHFSTRAQLAKTLQKKFAHTNTVMLLEVLLADIPSAVATHLKWEKNNPAGDTYPHLYTNLPMTWVRHTYKLTRQPDGTFHVPDLSS